MMTATAPIKSMTAKEILEKIHQYLPVREIEKNKFGEVFTPVELIEEMLDQLPKSVWSNPDLKWLDPANGIGNFPLVIYQRLLKGLKRKIPDLETRKEHILNNMLYMVEINPKNVMIARRIFGKKANISCADFLNQEDKWKRDFKGVNMFDIIVCNPPFQKPIEDKRDEGYGGGRTLWDKFVEKSLEYLRVNGYIGFINPPNWRGLGDTNKIWGLLRSKLIYLRIYNVKAGLEWFNASTRFDIYMCQNCPSKNGCLVIDEIGKQHVLDLSKWLFFPNYNYKKIRSIIASPTNEKVNIIYSSSIYDARKKYMSKTLNKNHIYPVVYTMNRDGIQFIYTSDNTKGHFGISKVILSVGGSIYPYNDHEGKYGMSQNAFGIPISSKKEGDMIVKAINTPEFKEIIKATKWGAFQTDYRMFNYFKKDFYKYFL
jgi:hypothetical protein